MYARFVKVHCSDKLCGNCHSKMVVVAGMLTTIIGSIAFKMKVYRNSGNRYSIMLPDITKFQKKIM